MSIVSIPVKELVYQKQIIDEEWYCKYLDHPTAEEISFLQEPTFPMQECQNLDRIRLIYLATLQNQQETIKSPLNLETERACSASQHQKKNVKWSIIGGLSATALLFAPLNYLALQNDVIATSTAMTIQTIVTAALSYYATGIAPYLASNRDNEMQNEIHNIELIYSDLGQRLLRLYKGSQEDRLFAEEIAKRLNFDLIFQRIHSKIESETLTRIIVGFLKGAAAHINLNLS